MNELLKLVLKLSVSGSVFFLLFYQKNIFSKVASIYFKAKYDILSYSNYFNL